MTSLQIDRVRSVARQCNLIEVSLDEKSRVIAFRSDDDTRFSVYYSTGTVGTSLNHPRQGNIQLFRRNVNMALLKTIFATPRIKADFGYHQGEENNNGSRKRVKMSNGRWKNISTSADGIVEGEENAAKNQFQKLIAEKNAIEKEINEVKGIISDCGRRREEERKMAEEEKKRSAAEKERPKNDNIENRGKWARWSLNETDVFDKNFTQQTSCVAVGNDGAHLCLYDNGKWAHSKGLPDGLYKALKSKWLDGFRPTYVAMGSMNRYYIQFANGESLWEGPDTLTKLLRKTKKAIKSVAFGETWDDYFVVFADGGFEYAGCPNDLDAKILSRECRGDLEKVSLGPCGEWTLWAQNGRAWWGNLRDEVAQEINSLQQKNSVITDILFGQDDAYFVRYRK